MTPVLSTGARLRVLRLGSFAIALRGPVDGALRLAGHGDGNQVRQFLLVLQRRHPHWIALERDDEIGAVRWVEQCPLPIRMVHLADDVPQGYAGLLRRAYMLALVHEECGGR